MHRVRFTTKIRDEDYDVEMDLLSLSPVKFTIMFHGKRPEMPLARPEISKLCREAHAHMKKH